MKIETIAQAAKLSESFNTKLKVIQAIKTSPLNLEFGGYTVTLSVAGQASLRERILLEQEDELHKIGARLQEMGVEL